MNWSLGVSTYGTSTPFTSDDCGGYVRREASDVASKECGETVAKMEAIGGQ
jgi:hypothetical protein